MSTVKGQHLEEDQIIRVVVDEADLSPQLQEHLSACPLCRAERERLEKDLERLGRMAERFAPLPKKRVSLPVEEPRGFGRWSWGWRPAFSVAVSAVVVAFVLWTSLPRAPLENGPGRLTQELQEAEQLMSEVDTLVENALPPLYLEITGEEEEDSDEEFLQFIVPAADNQSQTNHSNKNGGKSLC